MQEKLCRTRKIAEGARHALHRVDARNSQAAGRSACVPAYQARRQRRRLAPRSLGLGAPPRSATRCAEPDQSSTDVIFEIEQELFAPGDCATDADRIAEAACGALPPAGTFERGTSPAPRSRPDRPPTDRESCRGCGCAGSAGGIHCRSARLRPHHVARGRKRSACGDQSDDR